MIKIFNQQGWVTLGIKPVASGGFWQHETLFSDDALALQQVSSVKSHYEHINPFVFEPPIAPHIAAMQSSCALNVELIQKKLHFSLQTSVDIRLIEGMGGWYVPLNTTQTMADFVKINNMRVILVVGLKLGCLNHAILTCKAMLSDKIPIIGWIANGVDANMLAFDENILALQQWLPIPCLGIVHYGEQPEQVLQLRSFVKSIISPCTQ